MLYRLIAIYLAFFTILAQPKAQKPNVHISDDYELPNDQVLQGHLFSNAQAHYIWFTKQPFAGRTNKIIIERYDKNLKRQAVDEYKTESKKISIHGLKYFKGKFIWLMSEKDKKNDKIEYQVSKIALDGSLTKAKKISSFDYNEFLDEPEVEWAVSEDTSKVFFASLPDNNKKTKDFKANLTVLDDDVSKLWSKTIKLPYTERQVQPISWAISNKGEVYFLAKIFEYNNTKETKRGKNGKEPRYVYYIFLQNDKDSQLIKKKLDLENAFVNGAGIRVDKNGNLACTGFYRESSRGPIQGVFYLKFDAETNDAVYSDIRDFTPKELDSFGRYNISKDRKTKEEGLDNNFRFSAIEFLDDGSLIAIAEEFEIRVHQYNDGRGNIRTTYTYICNSIVDIHVGPGGDVNMVNIVPKRMQSNTAQYAYHATLNDGKNIYYFYNDSRSNVENNITEPDKMRSPSGLKSYVAVMSYYDSRGKFHREELFRSKDVGSLMMPGKCQQIDKNSMFFFNTRHRFLSGSTFQFGVVTVE